MVPVAHLFLQNDLAATINGPSVASILSKLLQILKIAQKETIEKTQWNFAESRRHNKTKEYYFAFQIRTFFFDQTASTSGASNA